jgi:AhpD family alkylhydroperoxidase
MSESLYPSSSPTLSGTRKRLAPEIHEAFQAFSRTVFADGALSTKTKQLIAVAVAHVTQCPYCIRGHTKAAIRHGASHEELMEAIWVAAEMRRRRLCTLNHSNRRDGEDGASSRRDQWYAPANSRLKRRSHLRRLAIAVRDFKGDFEILIHDIHSHRSRGRTVVDPDLRREQRCVGRQPTLAASPASRITSPSRRARASLN